MPCIVVVKFHVNDKKKYLMSKLNRKVVFPREVNILGSYYRRQCKEREERREKLFLILFKIILITSLGFRILHPSIVNVEVIPI